MAEKNVSASKRNEKTDELRKVLSECLRSELKMQPARSAAASGNATGTGHQRPCLNWLV